MTRPGDNWRKTPFPIGKTPQAPRPDVAVGLPQMFVRTCICGNKFKVPETSSALSCSRQCAARHGRPYP